jgi:hypothetical protein
MSTATVCCIKHCSTALYDVFDDHRTLCTGNTGHLATGFVNTETNPGTLAVGLYSGMWAYDGWCVSYK